MFNKYTNIMKKYYGFSLIEILVSLVILSVGLLAIAALQTKMLTEGSLSKEKSVAEYYAKQKMEELRRLGCGIDCINLPIDSSPLPNPNPRSNKINSYSSEFTRTWSIANGPTENIRLVKILVSWLDQTGLTKSVELVSYISQFDQLDFANLTYPPGSNTSPISTIKDWKSGGQNYEKDSIVRYKSPDGTTIKYYIKLNKLVDTWNATSPATDTANWIEIFFIQGELKWTPNNSATHTVCELRFGDFGTTEPSHGTDEISSFGLKQNGRYDATAINPNINPLINGATNSNYKPRRCSPNLLSGIGVLTSNYACYFKAGETQKKIFAQCEIEDGNGGTATVGPMSNPLNGFIAEQTGFNISLSQISPLPTSTPTVTPVSTATPVATPTVIPDAKIKVIVNMGSGNFKDSTTCNIVNQFNANCAVDVVWLTNPEGNTEIQQRIYGATCTLIEANATAAISCQNTKGNQSVVITTPKPLESGVTTEFTFNNM